MAVTQVDLDEFPVITPEEEAMYAEADAHQAYLADIDRHVDEQTRVQAEIDWCPEGHECDAECLCTCDTCQQYRSDEETHHDEFWSFER